MVSPGPVIADGRLILFERVGNREQVSARDVNTGTKSWTFEYGTTYQDDFGFDDGPRSAPTIANGKIYTFGAEGMLTCLNLQTGKKQWSVDTRAQYGFRKAFFWRRRRPAGGRQPRHAQHWRIERRWYCRLRS